MQSPTITLRLPEPTYNALNEVIETSGMTRSEIVRDALDLYFQTHSIREVTHA